MNTFRNLKRIDERLLMSHPFRCMLFTAVALLGCVGPSMASEFIALGDLPGGLFESWARGVSDDGKVVAGYSASVDRSWHFWDAFVWTEEEGMVGLGDLPGGFFRSRATDVSTDGSTVVGNSGFGENVGEAFIWTDDEGMVGFGPGTEAFGVSANGEIIVGRLRFPGRDRRAWYWTNTEGIVDLDGLPGGSGLNSIALDVNSDGTVIVGTADADEGSRTHAVRWTNRAGLGFEEAERLGQLPGGDLGSEAWAVSADGSVIVGRAVELGHGGFIWTESNGMQDLGLLVDHGGRITPTGVNGDGSIVVGGSSITGGDRDRSRVDKAIIWNETNGIRNLQDVLVEEYGLAETLQGWNLWNANDISSNGQYIVGIGRNPDRYDEAWLVRLDYPYLGTQRGDFDGNSVLDIVDVQQLSGTIVSNTGDTKYDLTSDNLVNGDDLEVWVHDLKGTWFGDADLDGQFGPLDLVSVLSAGKYEQNVLATWSEGDWNADGLFNALDVVTALQDDGYLQGPHNAIPAVPEASSLTLALLGMASLMVRRRRKGITNE